LFRGAKLPAPKTPLYAPKPQRAAPPPALLEMLNLHENRGAKKATTPHKISKETTQVVPISKPKSQSPFK
jgi:hypothetical protein